MEVISAAFIIRLVSSPEPIKYDQGLSLLTLLFVSVKPPIFLIVTLIGVSLGVDMYKYCSQGAQSVFSIFFHNYLKTQPMLFQ